MIRKGRNHIKYRPTIHPIMIKNCCSKKQIVTSNDGNKRQKCLNCGAEWKAYDVVK
jgi:hypothetical protein